MSFADASGNKILHLETDRDLSETEELQLRFLRAQRLDSIGAIASGIAHDLNNIFTPILLASGVLDETLTDEQQRHLLAAVKSSAERGGDLVKQILLFTRGQAGFDAALSPETVMADLCAMLNETFPKTIRIEATIAPDLAPIRANATQLHQVLLNLCVNARDAMPKGGVLRLAANNFILADPNRYSGATTGPYVRFTVNDSGSGIPPELRSRIFEPFFTTKKLGEGTGMGLYTVRSIVEEHKGFIDLLSEVGKGTEFSIFLPALPAGSAAKSRTPLPVVLPPPQGETILLVDDELGILEMLEALLKKSGYRTITASGGPQALAVISDRNIRVDLVLIDVIMPLLDGPATIRAFRSVHPDIPIIAMSGLAANQKLIEELKNTTFLLKPFSPNQLLEAIRRALRSESSS
jgi:two-component system cell cycle sensor histidine kinase/response regulator CckA